MLSLGLFLGMAFFGCEADNDAGTGTQVVSVNDGNDVDQTAADIIRYNGNQGEPIVMVHGNAGYPSHWDRTVSYFLSHGWTSSKIIRPNWGSKTCAACNDHCGSELDTVIAALQTAKNQSSTGKIDVMGHSMGVTLAAKAILSLGWGSGQVRSFIGIAGAFRGLNSCGTYPYNVWSTTCMSCGLSKNSPLINSLAGKRFAQKQYAIYSWVDEIVCYGGCTVGGVHTSIPQVLDGSRSYSTVPYGHFGLMYYTESVQADFADNY